jgi:hypothetical protein
MGKLMIFFYQNYNMIETKLHGWSKNGPLQFLIFHVHQFFLYQYMASTESLFSIHLNSVDLSRFWRSCLSPFGLRAPKSYLFGFRF